MFQLSEEDVGDGDIFPSRLQSKGLQCSLQSKEATIVNIQIIRAFVAMREAISVHGELGRKLEKLEYRLGQHDDEIAA